MSIDFTWTTAFNAHRKAGQNIHESMFFASQWVKRQYADRWKHCSSTHCERTGECCSPHECDAALKSLNAVAAAERDAVIQANKEK